MSVEQGNLGILVSEAEAHRGDIAVFMHLSLAVLRTTSQWQLTFHEDLLCARLRAKHCTCAVSLDGPRNLMRGATAVSWLQVSKLKQRKTPLPVGCASPSPPGAPRQRTATCGHLPFFQNYFAFHPTPLAQRNTKHLSCMRRTPLEHLTGPTPARTTSARRSSVSPPPGRGSIKTDCGVTRERRCSINADPRVLTTFPVKALSKTTKDKRQTRYGQGVRPLVRAPWRGATPGHKETLG